MAISKAKNGDKIVDTTETGKTIKNMVLLFKFMEMKIVTKEDGSKICVMAKVPCGLTLVKESYGKNTQEIGPKIVKLVVELSFSKMEIDMMEHGWKIYLTEKVE